MKFSSFYICDEEGKSNCIIRSFVKMYNEVYENIYRELCDIAKELNCSSFNDIEVFETYMKKRKTEKIEYGKDMQIKDLELNNGNYIVFCYDKNEFYHMVTIMDNILYDKDEKSLDLYVITIYKQN